MRAALLGLAASVIAGQALAADYLRGSYEPVKAHGFRWDGVYVGGQAGWASSNATFEATPMFDGVTPGTWPALATTDYGAASYGGFIGYNGQWGDIVLGVEANYNHTNLRNHSTGNIAGVDYTGTTRITDYGALRFRAGYAWDWVMPYVTAGFALARADVSRSAIPPFAPTITDQRTGVVTFGYSVGLGVDVALMQHVFVRAEYEFAQFKGINDSWISIGTARGAVGLKF